MLEAVVALGVLSVGVFAVQRSIRQASLTQAQTSDYTWARFLLQQVISEVEIQPVVVPGTQSGNFAGDFARFSYSRKVSLVKIPMPPLPPMVPGGVVPGAFPGGPPPVPMGPDGKPLVMLKERYIGGIWATVRWERAGARYEASAETLFNPDKLWLPEEARAGVALP